MLANEQIRPQRVLHGGSEMVAAGDGMQLDLGGAAALHGVVGLLGVEEGDVVVGGAVEEGQGGAGLPVVDVIIGQGGSEGRIRIIQHGLTEGGGEELALLAGHGSKRVGLQLRGVGLLVVEGEGAVKAINAVVGAQHPHVGA